MGGTACEGDTTDAGRPVVFAEKYPPPRGALIRREGNLGALAGVEYRQPI